MTGPDGKAKKQIAEAYAGMASTAKYRPAAPSDGFGNITVSVDELNMAKEVSDYTERWWSEENLGEYNIGVPSFEGRKALIFVIEAARNICAVQYGTALKLLNLASEEIKKAVQERKDAGMPERF